ncbi:MAG TPA: hypothetical protein VJP45_00720, partial [Candidatus Limnocylindria bacterium]|nr:hypothetical protein [Candidatus Limnocylindria bacterium]
TSPSGYGERGVSTIAVPVIVEVVYMRETLAPRRCRGIRRAGESRSPVKVNVRARIEFARK